MASERKERLIRGLGPKFKKGKENLTDRLCCQYFFNLTYDQLVLIDEKRNYKDLLVLAREVFQNPDLTEQSSEYNRVRKYWGRTVKYYDFTEDQLDFLLENGETMGIMDMLRVLFPEENNVPKSASVTKLLKAAGIVFRGEASTPEIAIDNKYTPPRTDPQIIEAINRADPSAKYHIAKLDQRKKDSIAATKRFISSPHFVQLASGIRDAGHRDVFENEFIKAVYNKPDLSTEDVNLYIGLSMEYVTRLELRQQIAILNDRLAESIADDEEGKKFTMTLTENLKDIRKALNDCSDKIMKAAKSLSGDRVKKLEQQAKVNASLTQFVELLQDEKERDRLMLIARADELKIRDTIKEIEDYSDVFAEVFGVGKEEIYSL